MTLTSRILSHWGAELIEAQPAFATRLAAFQLEHDVILPQILVDLCSVCDGYANGFTDAEMFRFWPLSELEFCTDTCYSGKAGRYLIFADFMIWSHGYAVDMAEGSSAGSVGLVGADERIIVAESIEEFFELYLINSPKLQGVTGCARSHKDGP